MHFLQKAVIAGLALIGQSVASDPQNSFSTTNNANLSPLGTLPTIPLPDFLADGPLFNGFPWGAANPAGAAPNTGKIRTYNLTASRSYRSIDGFNKSVILINGQFPGPTIEANWGDIIQVTVNNQIVTDMVEGLTLHWHGLTQVKTPWYDGVPGVSQCPIAPGSSFTYQFQADQYGTSWYHSHVSGQYGDGLFGPMVIHGPVQSGVKYDLDIGPVMLHNYIHKSYIQVMQGLYSAPPQFPNMDNNLINGKVNAQFNFTNGKVHRLRLINSGSEASQKFTIDNHNMTVIAYDFVPIKPITTNVVTLGIGQRADVLVYGSGKPTDVVYMRSDIDLSCGGLTGQPHALATIFYPNADRTATPNTTATPWNSNNCANDPLNTTVPFYTQTPPSSPATTQIMEIDLAVNSSGFPEFRVNNESFHANYNNPVLLLTKENGSSTSFPPEAEQNFYNFGQNSSVRMIWKNNFPAPHPMHLHGHNMWVLAEGYGEWDGTVTNPRNPARRDTHLMQPGFPGNPSYIVVEWRQDNPGVWPFHCHISTHVSAGLYVNVVERPADVQRDMDIPMVMAQTCRDWSAYTANNTPDTIDSGV